jgi:hypothetical protein
VTIQATCDGCFRTFGVKDQFAGRRIKCPDCGAAIQIPDGRPSAPSPADDFGGDPVDDFGDDFAAAPERPRSRKPRPSSGKQSGSGSSFAVVAAVIGVVGLFVIALCGGGIWLGVMAVRNAAEGPIAAQQDRQIEQALAGRQVGGTREESGRLAFGDETLESGEYVDQYSISANAGDVFVIDMYSDDFDTYLIVADESEFSDFQIENDDFSVEDTAHSQVVLTAPANGTFLVLATSFESGETGSYQLSIREVAPDAGGGGPIREETGSLAPGDATLELGEFTDVYPLTAEQGDLFVIDMHADQFDTYLLITGPNDFSIENDDFEGSTSHSQVTLLVPTTGTYEINATSLAGGETGSYRLTIQER